MGKSTTALTFTISKALRKAWLFNKVLQQFINKKTTNTHKGSYTAIAEMLPQDILDPKFINLASTATCHRMLFRDSEQLAIVRQPQNLVVI